MNKRIAELLNECTEPGFDKPCPLVDHEKFAKLIIKECLDIIENERYNTNMLLSMPGQSSAAYNAKWKIIERFGVK